jgi:hypothetical protein
VGTGEEGAATLARALEILGQLPELRAATPLPLAEVQTLAMELLFERALSRGLEGAVLASPAYQRYAAGRR